MRRIENGRVVAAEEFNYHALFASEASPGGEVIVSTQNQPTYARFVFPCADEPKYKALFQFNIWAPTTGAGGGNVTVLGNTAPRAIYREEAVQFVQFETTPHPMSSYLVALAIGELNNVSSTATVYGQQTEFGVWVPKRSVAVGDGEFGLYYSILSLQWFADHFGQGFAWPKVDSVAVPGRGGAMENFGLVLYGYDRLLASSQSSFVENQTALNTITHELAHQWFGNSVTCQWWADTFLNEGFARYYGYLAASAIEPSWDSWNTHFIPRRLIGAMAADSTGLANAVLKTEAQTASASGLAFGLGSAFDTITYNKGGALLRYFVWIAGESPWNAAMREYLAKFQFQSVAPADLYAAVDAKIPGLSFKMKPWLTRRGFPALSLRLLNASRLEIMQSPVGSTDSKPWYISVMIQFLPAANKGRENQVNVSFDTERAEFALPFEVGPDGAAIVNPGMVAYVATRYPLLWEQRLTRAEIWSGIGEHERLAFTANAAVLMDSCVGGSSAARPLTSATRVIANISGAESAAVWLTMLSSWTTRFGLLQNTTTFSTAFPTIASAIRVANAESKPWSSSTGSGPLASAANEAAWAGVVYGEPISVQSARSLLSLALTSFAAVPAPARAAVLFAGVAYGNATVFNDVRDLWQNSSSESEQTVMRTGLLASSDSSLCSDAYLAVRNDKRTGTATNCVAIARSLQWSRNAICRKEAFTLLFSADTASMLQRQADLGGDLGVYGQVGEAAAKAVVFNTERILFENWVSSHRSILKSLASDLDSRLVAVAAQRVASRDCLES